MNRRQRNKIVPNIWIIAAKRSDTDHNYFAIYAIDWKRGARLSWEGWTRYEDFCNFVCRSNEKLKEAPTHHNLPLKSPKRHCFCI